MPYTDKKKQIECSRQSARRAYERALATPLTQARLREVLKYDCQTGHFLWVAARPRFVGKAAGKLNSDGHRQIKIDGRYYQAHRLVWLYLYGAFPANTIDHVDGNPDNNALSNLREATRSQNQMNVKRRVDNRSGKRGVSYNKRQKLWVAYIQKDGAFQVLGGFAELDAAIKERSDAEARLYGKFNRTGT